MNEINKVTVRINGSDYSIVGPKPEEHMLKVARYVDQEIIKITNANSKLSTSSAAILSAVNIANELFECGEENDELLRENDELKKKVGTGEEELKLEMRKLELSLQGKAKAEEDLKTKIDELNKLIEEQKSRISKLESDIQSKDKQIEEYKVEIDELKDLTKIAEEKARVAEEMSSKFQNAAYRVQLEKIEIENELKFYKATK